MLVRIALIKFAFRNYVKEEEEEEKDVDMVFSRIKIHEFSVKVRINH